MTTTPHGQVPEALIDLIDAYAETRHRCGRIYNARTEAARNAVIEALSGGQALSAAPAIKPLVWSDESGPTDKIRYNHITAETALGQFSVEWKGWKEEDGPCVYLAGDYIGVASDLGGAKKLAEQHIRELVSNLLAATPTPPAEQQAEPGAVDRTGCTAGTDEECTRRGCATSCPAQQAAPEAVPGVGNSGFDHQTAADFLSGKTVSDEAVRKFVAASRRAHDEKAALSATLLAMHGVLTSREAEIALLKKALLEAEAAPQQEAQEPVAWLDPWTGTKVTTDYDAYGKHGIPLYTAPQPVAREPLTDEQLAEMMRDTWGCASIAPRHALAFARAVERAHGITQKGGSNAE